MRVAVAFDCLYPLSTGGAERFYRQVSEVFARQGCEVDYLARLQWSGPAPTAEGVTVVAVSGAAAIYDESGTRRVGPAIRYAWGLFRHLARNRNRYDIAFISATPVLNVFAACLALAGSRVTVCADFFEVWRREQWLEYSGPIVGRIAAALQSVAIRVSPWVSCYSQMHARRLEADRPRRPPIVSPGIIHDVVATEPRLAPSAPPTVVYAGRHIPDKQVEALPAAVEWARRTVPDLRCTIIGNGATRQLVADEVRRRSLEGVVETPGFVDEETLRSAMGGAAVFVNPSKREGYGMVVVEACSFGTPVVVVEAADNAATELIDPGVNGLIASSTAPADLGAAIVKVVQAGSPLRETTRAWFEGAARTKTVDATARQLLEVLSPASVTQRTS